MWQAGGGGLSHDSGGRLVKFTGVSVALSERRQLCPRPQVLKGLSQLTVTGNKDEDRCNRTRMSRMDVPIQVNDAIMGGLAAVLRVYFYGHCYVRLDLSWALDL